MKNEKFKEILEESKSEIMKLKAQLIQIDSTIEALEKKAEFIENDILKKIANDLKDYLENKKSYEINDLTKKTGTVYFGTNYNDLIDIDNANLSAWEIKAADSSLLYSIKHNWDNDEKISKYMELWDWWHDYLIHRMDNFDGKYGIYQMIETMTRARNSIYGSILKYSQIESKIGEI